MPMYVVRTKRINSELERQKKWMLKQREKGSKVDKCLNYLPLDNCDALEEYDLSLNLPAAKKNFQREGVSAIGRQKKQGKSISLL
ncbi:hypothetical protein DCF83_18005 (plasmid) [Edwardsiella tarda]|uniref:hypothetical protein n=1 Tax=Edwardsiella tarda TaxID=636 RepID=UPI0011B1FBE6|nr:hypothetical protein [Edwardsiella tarda]UCQ29613.1 hypothetical protein DCF83_18005 [Edwardsiella tarda]